MKAGNRRFLILLSILTALCCAAAVLINFAGMPPFDSVMDTGASISSIISASSTTIISQSVSLENTSGAAQTVSVSSAVSGTLVNLNTADAAALTALPGIGDTLAQRIIDYRKEHGHFTSVDQLDQVKGIGEKKLAALKGLITV